MIYTLFIGKTGALVSKRDEFGQGFWFKYENYVAGDVINIDETGCTTTCPHHEYLQSVVDHDILHRMNAIMGIRAAGTFTTLTYYFA